MAPLHPYQCDRGAEELEKDMGKHMEKGDELTVANRAERSVRFCEQRRGMREKIDGAMSGYWVELLRSASNLMCG